MTTRPLLPALTATLAALLSAGCATSHYYTGTGSETYRIGTTAIRGSMRVSASPHGVSITPSVRYFRPRSNRR